MSKRITAFLISLCFFILMTTPMAALAAEEIPTADTAETVSGNDLTGTVSVLRRGTLPISPIPRLFPGKRRRKWCPGFWKKGAMPPRKL